MKSCGPRNIFVFINLNFTEWFLFLSTHQVTITEEDHIGGKNSSLFSTQTFPPNVSNLPNCCIFTLTVMVAIQSDGSQHQAACRYRLLTAGQNIGIAASICFAVTSRVLPSKEHKINKRT
jgi:hypothetical protein